MSFFTASKKKEDIKQGGSSYITKSGIYPISLLAPFASTSDGGSTTVDLFVEHGGQKQVVYGSMRITNNDGSVNKIGNKVFNQLVIVAGVEEVADPISHDLPIGKNGKLEEVAVLEDLAEIDVLMQVQMEYTVYKNNIQEKKVIRGFYRADDKASAEEIVNESGYGTQYEKDEKYFDKVTYKDGLDAAAIARWIADNRPKGDADNYISGEGGTSSEKSSKAPAFGKKKTFGS